MAEYAVYKGDQFIDLGTADYLANKFGVLRKTIWYWTAQLTGRKTKVIRWLLYELKMINIED